MIRDQIEGIKARSLFKDLASYTFVSKIEPKMINKTLTDDD